MDSVGLSCRFPPITAAYPGCCRFGDSGSVQVCFARESCRTEVVSLLPTSIPIRGIRRRMHSKTASTFVTVHVSGRVYESDQLYWVNHSSPSLSQRKMSALTLRSESSMIRSFCLLLFLYFFQYLIIHSLRYLLSTYFVPSSIPSTGIQK